MSKLSDVLNDAKFRIFDPSPGKIKGGVGEISIPIVELKPYLRSNLRNPFDGQWPSTTRLLKAQ